MFKINFIIKFYFIFFNICFENIMGIGDWGLGIGDWGLGPIPNPQSPNPQSPIPILFLNIVKNNYKINI